MREKFMNFTKAYKKIAINHNKLKEFSYCTLEFNGDAHDLLTDALIKDNKILTYLKDSDEGFDFLKTNLHDKLVKLRTAATEKKSGFFKNDGIYLNFLAFEALKDLYNILPLYLLQRSDVEAPKLGVDSVFYCGQEIWIFEFKSSTSTLKEEDVAIKVYDGVESLFCKGDIKTASLFDCKTMVKKNKLDVKLKDVLQRLIDNRADTEKLMDGEDMKFNVCIVAPIDTFSEDDIKDYINKKYLSCDGCSFNPCKQYKCPKFEKIKILNVFHLQLPCDFNLETLYDKLLLKMENKI